jgi:hypothetical protein
VVLISVFLRQLSDRKCPVSLVLKKDLHFRRKSGHWGIGAIEGGLGSGLVLSVPGKQAILLGRKS